MYVSQLCGDFINVLLRNLELVILRNCLQTNKETLGGFF